jgi:SnoaL-like domain
MDRTTLQTYLSHFNNRRYEQQAAYYAPDVAFELPTLTLRGPQAIIDLYKEFHPHVREHVEIADMIASRDKVFVVLPSRFEVLSDFKKYGLDFEAGKLYEIVSFIFYELESNKFKRIRSARQSAKISNL